MDKANAIFEEFIHRYPCLKGVHIKKAFALLWKSYKEGGKTLVCGNGGSASDSEHIIGELMKGFLLRRKLTGSERKRFGSIEGGEEIADQLQRAFPAISLNSQTSLLTAIGNDISYDMVFAQQVYGYGCAKDVLMALTTSGNSKDVVLAAKTAKIIGMKIIGITGNKPSKIKKICDVCLTLPATETYKVQELTLPVYHVLCAMLEKELFE
jgi:phosphoheptose isomerase